MLNSHHFFGSISFSLSHFTQFPKEAWSRNFIIYE